MTINNLKCYFIIWNLHFKENKLFKKWHSTNDIFNTIYNGYFAVVIRKYVKIQNHITLELPTVVEINFGENCYKYSLSLYSSPRYLLILKYIVVWRIWNGHQRVNCLIFNVEACLGQDFFLLGTHNTKKLVLHTQ